MTQGADQDNKLVQIKIKMRAYRKAYYSTPERKEMAQRYYQQKKKEKLESKEGIKNAEINVEIVETVENVEIV